MTWMILESYLLLMRIEIPFSRNDLAAIHSFVRNKRMNGLARRICPTVEQLCRAMDLACVFYPKEVRCLQRSAATAVLLRRYGYDGEMVIGAQMVPFKSHAWVEVRGSVVNDKPYIVEIYKPLARC